MKPSPLFKFFTLAVQLLLLTCVLASPVNAKTALGGYQANLDASMGQVAYNPLNELENYLNSSCTALGFCNGADTNLGAPKNPDIDADYPVIDTPYGPAKQSTSPEALAAREAVENGATVNRGGTLGKSQTTEGQFWSTDNPNSPGYAERNGIPSENYVDPDFTISGKVKDDFVTREAPGVGENSGGAIEIVTKPGGVKADNFVMPEKVSKVDSSGKLSSDASTPVGRRASPGSGGADAPQSDGSGRHNPQYQNPDYQPVQNKPATISGRDYSGHALDQMRNRGVVPSVVDNAIKTGNKLPGNTPGTSVYHDPINSVRVVVNSAGKVVTVE